MAKTTETPLARLPETKPKLPRKGNLNPPPKPSLGGNTYASKTYAPVFAQPRGKKQDYSLNSWSNTAIILADRALRAAQTYGKKDFNSLYRLVLSAGIAYDKAFPQQQVASGGNLVIQLFGSLGSDVTRAILEPPRPVLDITPPVESLASITLAPIDEPTLPSDDDPLDS